ncbi:quercetin 2,3-dioxygenase [Pseudovibrio japonicus]|uniref:Quercetin 2,3-dioxygenase n=1 Tax=Pseudovibrio japonicus TaxID=366534 RepID=A0ABQ3EHM8_9HYPH|nr:pirin family protein [Pseudovibrio japonicus]GHB31099.1 quercetin 2,3-dioxygenase [Pseudovibrio japonicus]
MTNTATDLRLRVRPSHQRGHVDAGWLKTAHSFSFASYFDRNNMNFHNLRVMNDDWIDPAAGFPMHPHENFEIFSYMLEGALAHEDTMGNGSTVHKGGIQFMSTGSGVQHSEFNPSSTEKTHILQIWLIPDRKNTTPRYEMMDLGDAERDGKLQLFLSHDGRNGSIRTEAAADVYSGKLNGADTISFELNDERAVYVHVARGEVQINGETLSEGDAIDAEGQGQLLLNNGKDAEVIVFHLSPRH